MTYPFSTVLITPAQFHAAVTNPSRRIVPVAAGRRAIHTPSYQTHHIPGSVFFDLDTIRDTTSPYPQMLPSAEQFASSLSALGIRNDDILVIYDAADVGIYSSPRVAWMFRVFGHAYVHVLNSFRGYLDLGYPISSGEFPMSVETEYCVPTMKKTSVVEFEELRDVILRGGAGYQIVDVRVPSRFSGREDDANGLTSGHMPDAINLPLAAMLDKSSRGFLPLARLRRVLEEAGIDAKRPMVLTCNSGVTAAALDLVLGEIGYRNLRRVYDGSWMEWARRVDRPGLIVRD